MEYLLQARNVQNYQEKYLNESTSVETQSFKSLSCNYNEKLISAWPTMDINEECNIKMIDVSNRLNKLLQNTQQNQKLLKTKIIDQMLTHNAKQKILQSHIFQSYLQYMWVDIFKRIVRLCYYLKTNVKIIFTTMDILERFFFEKYKSQEEITNQPLNIWLVTAFYMAVKFHCVQLLKIELITSKVLQDKVSWQEIINAEKEIFLKLKGSVFNQSNYEKIISIIDMLKFNNQEEKERVKQIAQFCLLRVYFSWELLETFTENELTAYILLISIQLYSKENSNFIYKKNKEIIGSLFAQKCTLKSEGFNKIGDHVLKFHLELTEIEKEFPIYKYKL